MDITEFLTGRLDEDDADAHAAADVGLGIFPTWAHDPAGSVVAYPYSLGIVMDVGSAIGTHIARWDPARVLAEITAKRAMIALHAVEDERMHECAGSDPAYGVVTDYVANCQTLRLLTAPYADHPDYDPAWATE